MKPHSLPPVVAAWALFASAVVIADDSRQSPAPASPTAVLSTEFIYQQAPFPECHASSIAESSAGLVCAWFGGTEEGHKDVGIWVSRRETNGWTAPIEVATGVESAEKRWPCWNPVLHQASKGPLLLFYKVGPNPRTWWGLLMASTDGGKTWSAPRRLPGDIIGPIKNKPIELVSGELLCPTSTEDDGWRVHFESTPDLGATWTRTKPVNDGKEFAAIQPTILRLSDGRLQALCRSRQKCITEIFSTDHGKTWSPMKATTLPNSSTGIDGVTLRDGRHLLVYNHTPSGRSPLNVGISTDGKQWKNAIVLENDRGEYSYPAVIQSADGKVHITYTWKRERIKHVVVAAEKP